MKKLFLTAALLPFILLTFKASAQENRNAISTNGLLNKMQTDMLTNKVSDRHWYSNFETLENNEYTFDVLMKDNKTMTITSKMYADAGTHKCYLLVEDKTLPKNDPKRRMGLFVDQTVKITRKDAAGKEMVGMGTDSCWLFKVISGKINYYSHLSETKHLNYSYLKAFQIGNGPVQSLDSASLGEAVYKDPKAYKLVLNSEFFRAIQKYNEDNK